MDSEGFVAVYRSAARGWSFLRRAPGWRLHALGVVASLLTVQLLLMAFTGLRTVEDGVLEHGAVHLDVVPGTLDQRVQELYAALQELPSVRRVTYVPREQVYAQESERDASLGEFLERYDLANPFPDAFVVVPASARAYAELRVFVEENAAGIDAVTLSEIAAREASASQLLAAAGTARAGAGLLVLLCAISAALLSLNLLVHLAAMRRAEESIERLAGATPAVLAAPLVAAGAAVLLGCLVAATALAAVVVALLGAFPSSEAIGAWMTGSVLAGWAVALPSMLGIEAFVMIILAWIVGRAGSGFRS